MSPVARIRGFVSRKPARSIAALAADHTAQTRSILESMNASNLAAQTALTSAWGTTKGSK